MIDVTVTRCETDQEQYQTSREIVERVGDNTRRRTVPVLHARTRVRFRGTFEVVDPSTDLVAASRTLAYEPEMTNSSRRELPDFPSPGAVAARAYRNTIRAIAPILFRWVETRDLVFFDDERCGLNLAHRAVEAGNYARALQISIANVSACQPGQVAEIDDRDVAAAHYNVGVLHRILGNFDSAMASFERARSADPDSGVVRDAIREARSAEEAAAGLRGLGGGRGGYAFAFSGVVLGEPWGDTESGSWSQTGNAVSLNPNDGYTNTAVLEERDILRISSHCDEGWELVLVR